MTPFERLLHRLGPDRAAAALEYEAIRGRLGEFFDWRGVPESDRLADEVLDRVGRKLETSDAIVQLRSFCFGVARHVLQELQAAGRTGPQGSGRRRAALPGTGEIESRVARLEDCLRELPPGQRELIVAYHAGRGRQTLEERRRFARQHHLSAIDLRIRAHRIRVQLELALRPRIAFDPAGDP